MKRFFSSLTRTSLSGLGSALLVTIIISIAASGLGMGGLYVFKYAQVTPEMQSLRCFVGFNDPDCPDRRAALREAEAEIAQLRQKTQEAESVFKRLEAAEAKLSSLKAIDNAVDSVTLFKSHPLGEHTLYRVTIGSIYSRLSVAKPKPTAFFCYIDKFGPSAQTISLYIHKQGERVNITDNMLQSFGITRAMLEEAHGHCKPYLIAGAQQ